MPRSRITVRFLHMVFSPRKAVPHFFFQFAYILYINFNFKIYQQFCMRLFRYYVILYSWLKWWIHLLIFRSYKSLAFLEQGSFLIVVVYCFLMHWIWLDNIMLLIFQNHGLNFHSLSGFKIMLYKTYKLSWVNDFSLLWERNLYNQNVLPAWGVLSTLMESLAGVGLSG